MNVCSTCSYVIPFALLATNQNALLARNSARTSCPKHDGKASRIPGGRGYAVGRYSQVFGFRRLSNPSCSFCIHVNQSNVASWEAAYLAEFLGHPEAILVADQLPRVSQPCAWTHLEGANHLDMVPVSPPLLPQILVDDLLIKTVVIDVVVLPHCISRHRVRHSSGSRCAPVWS